MIVTSQNTVSTERCMVRGGMADYFASPCVHNTLINITLGDKKEQLKKNLFQFYLVIEYK